jgi:hypothetical protein
MDPIPFPQLSSVTCPVANLSEIPIVMQSKGARIQKWGQTPKRGQVFLESDTLPLYEMERIFQFSGLALANFHILTGTTLLDVAPPNCQATGTPCGDTHNIARLTSAFAG